jgi:hypothetical protein
MSKVTIAPTQEPKLDHQLQALAEMMEREEKWWLEPGMDSPQASSTFIDWLTLSECTCYQRWYNQVRLIFVI